MSGDEVSFGLGLLYQSSADPVRLCGVLTGINEELTDLGDFLHLVKVQFVKSNKNLKGNSEKSMGCISPE